MKKFLALLLCAVFAFSLVCMTSCDGEDTAKILDTLAGKTPEELYDASVAALATATSYEVSGNTDIDMKMSIRGQDATMIMKQTSISKANGEETYVKSSANGEMTFMGQTVPLEDTDFMEVWYVDGVCYSDMWGVKAKATVDMDEFKQKYMDTDPGEETLLDLPESWFKDIKFEKVDGGYVLNFTVKGEEYTELFGDMFADMDIEFVIDGDVEYKIFFDKDGNLTKTTADFAMSYTMTIEMMSVSGTAVCTSVSTVSLKEVTIEAPANADEFTDVDLGLGE